MPKTIHYYMTVASPWTYFGHERLRAIAARFDALTQEAIDRQVFGAPTYIHDGELFWGQDRLDFLDRKLAQ